MRWLGSCDFWDFIGTCRAFVRPLQGAWWRRRWPIRILSAPATYLFVICLLRVLLALQYRHHGPWLHAETHGYFRDSTRSGDNPICTRCSSSGIFLNFCEGIRSRTRHHKCAGHKVTIPLHAARKPPFPDFDDYKFTLKHYELLQLRAAPRRRSTTSGHLPAPSSGPLLKRGLETGNVYQNSDALQERRSSGEGDENRTNSNFLTKVPSISEFSSKRSNSIFELSNNRTNRLILEESSNQL